jgi:hypothetical protein
MKDEFLRGYVCAIATVLEANGGINAAIKEAWDAGGYTFKECVANNVDSYDRSILRQYREELEP